MDQSFILQYVHACQGYQRFFHAWCRAGNNPDHCPTEIEWEQFSYPEPEPYRPSLSALLDLFPEAVRVAKQKLRELKDEERILEERCRVHLDEILAILKTTDPIFLEFANDLAFAEMQKHEEQVKHWEKIVKMDEFRRKPVGDDTITDGDILRAKEFPLTSFAKPNRAGFISCPFHTEKSASCKLYKDNRFHCFGCQADGDVIDFVMKQEGIDFLTAVKKILNK